jgi:cyanophycin synthetase
MEVPASAPCAAPTCGAATRPSRPSSPAHRSSATSPPCPASSRACARSFPAWARCADRTRRRAVAGPCARSRRARAAGARPAARSPSAAPATVEAGTYQVVVEYSEEAVGRLAFRTGAGPDPRGPARHRLRRRSRDRPAARPRRRRAPGPQHRLHRRCRRRARHSLPPPDQGSLVQFGWGSNQRRIQAAEVDSTSAVAESIAQDKDLTKKLLRAAGVPVPHRPPGHRRGRRLGRRPGGRPAGGRQAAGRQPGQGRHRQHQHTRPPRRGLQGRRRTSAKSWSRNSCPAATSACWWSATSWSRPRGATRRRWWATACTRCANWSTSSTADPRRGEGHATSLTKIRFDDIAVARLASRSSRPNPCPPRAGASSCATTPTSAPAAPPPT